jgi:hypothetical protein
MSLGVAVTILVIIVVVVGVLTVSTRLVGQVAEEFHEDPARWKAAMLPFGLLGPMVARVILARRNGGGGGLA